MTGSEFNKGWPFYLNSPEAGWGWVIVVATAMAISIGHGVQLAVAALIPWQIIPPSAAIGSIIGGSSSSGSHLQQSLAWPPLSLHSRGTFAYFTFHPSRKKTLPIDQGICGWPASYLSDSLSDSPFLGVSSHSQGLVKILSFGSGGSRSGESAEWNAHVVEWMMGNSRACVTPLRQVITAQFAPTILFLIFGVWRILLTTKNIYSNRRMLFNYIEWSNRFKCCRSI